MSALWLIILVLIVIFAVQFIGNRLRANKKNAFVVILGDIGRSPRMQFHSLSLSKAGFNVYVYGYAGSEPYRDVITNPLIHLRYLTPFPALFHKLPRVFVFALKVVWQGFTLLLPLLYSSQRPSHILLQNPPSLPTIAVCWLSSRILGSRFIIDWHNYGYTILALELGVKHPLVKIHKWYERLFGRLADCNICVTNAMKEDLGANWNVRPVVTMHDRPPAVFADRDVEQQHSLYRKLDIFHVDEPTPEGCAELTSRTVNKGGKISFREDRPAILASGTSWTEDEDFSILLHALDIYDERAAADTKLPKLICVITGKGPLKEFYRRQMEARDWSWVKVHTPWLEAADYPLMLASADLGVCLHKSSSGLDLPMKVVDMFGCRLPVCAVDFNCLHELVEHEVNGLVFRDKIELANQLQELLRDFPNQCHKLRRFRDNLKPFQQRRWDDEWTEMVQPLFV